MFGDSLLPSECSLIIDGLKQTSLCFQVRKKHQILPKEFMFNQINPFKSVYSVLMGDLQQFL